MSKPILVKEILAKLKEDETESLIREASRGIPVRLPNSDWDETDPRDLIDFPCAGCWLDYYHLRGLTPRHTSDYRGQRPDYKYYHLKSTTAQKKTGGVEI